jgi:hypothetical protein
MPEGGRQVQATGFVGVEVVVAVHRWHQVAGGPIDRRFLGPILPGQSPSDDHRPPGQVTPPGSSATTVAWRRGPAGLAGSVPDTMSTEPPGCAAHPRQAGHHARLLGQMGPVVEERARTWQDPHHRVGRLIESKKARQHPVRAPGTGHRRQH